MRWILLTLVVVNLGFGGWLYWQETQPAPEPRTDQPRARLNNLGLDAATAERLRQAGRERVAEAPPAPDQCLRITGISREDDAVVIESRLGALEVPTEREQRGEVVRTDYWVVLGPFDSEALARERLAELQAREVESFLISEGELAGGISLGLFSSRSNAESRLATLAEAGIDAAVEAVERTRQTYRLIIAAEPARMLSDGALDSILDQFDGVDYQRYAC